MTKRVICLFLALLTALSLTVPAFAEEDGLGQDVTPEITDAPVTDPTDPPVDPPVDTPADTPVPEVTDTPVPADTPIPAETPEASPSPDPLATPDPAEDPDPSETPSPSESPEPSKTPEPSESPEPSASPDPNAGIAPINYAADPAALVGKNRANLVLFVYFRDQANDYYSVAGNAANIKDWYDGGSARSFVNCISAFSGGQLQVTNLMPQYNVDGDGIIRAKQLSYSSSEAVNGNIDSGIIDQALTAVNITNGADLDLNGDGIVDNVTVILQSGPNTANSANNNSFHSHKSDYPSAKFVAGKRLGTYNIISTDSLKNSQAGVIVHEYLHTLGYPDLYNSTGEWPVGTWDIMAGSSYAPTWPLAYLRMYCTGWTTLPTITDSTTLSFCAPGDSAGDGSHQAYILRSPLNDREFFVIEMRRRNGNYGDVEVLDHMVSSMMSYGDAGLIVYRVNTNVDTLSNYHGSTGIYVFRPTSGYASQQQAVQAAFLNIASGRTTMGFSDMSKTQNDGAIAFADGSNSGIVISEVSGNSSRMTCKVTFPATENFDLWESTNFTSTAGSSDKRTTAVTTLNGSAYLAAYQNGKFGLYRYTGTNWAAVGSTWPASPLNGSEMCLVPYGGMLYVGYLDASGLQLCSVSPSDGTRTTVAASTGMLNNFSMAVLNGSLYIAGMGDQGKLWQLSGNTLSAQGTFFDSQGGAPILACAGGSVYVSTRSGTGDIYVYRCDGGSFTRVSDSSINANSYSMAAHNNHLCVVTTSDQTVVHTYDGNNWTHGQPTGSAYFDPKLTEVQGNLYMLTSASDGEGYTYVYQYDPASGGWVQEGEFVDAPSQQITLTSDGEYLYISYVLNKDRTICVKRKAIANTLLSLTVDVPPTKTVYTQGEAVNAAGLALTANYSRGTVSLTEKDCTITGFDTATVGQRTATVSYGGLTAMFFYQVLSPVPTNTPVPPVNTPTPTPVPTPKPVGRTGWAKEGGRWYWYENGVRAANRFVDGGRFYVGPDGVMLTGWQKISGSWYYFQGGNSGRMLTGWQKIGSGWYYLDPATGRMATGLTNVGGSWYCLAPGDSGRMLTGWQKINGSWYYFKGGSSGRMLTGWQKIGSGWYYLDPASGKMATGFTNVGGNWYYLTPGDSGRMLTGWQKIGGSWYYFKGGSSGRMLTGWQKISGGWYYLDPATGKMATGLIDLGGVRYYLRPGDSGRMLTGWISLGGGNWYYAYGSGALARNSWVRYKGGWYYLKDDCMMARNETINGYSFNDAGVWVG